MKKEKREKGNPLLGGKLIPSWNSNFQQSPSPISSRVSTRFLLVSLSLLDEALIVSDAPLIAEVIFLSRGRRLRDKKEGRASRILPSKDAGPLAFNADASSPLIPHGLPPTAIRSVLGGGAPISRQDPVVAQKDYPSCSRGYSLRSKGLRVG